jgi:hypothetical protein
MNWDRASGWTTSPVTCWIAGTLQHYIDDFSVTGLTSNPTIFDHAIRNSASYDRTIREKLARGESGEQLFFDLALEDITRAADQFLPIFERSNGVDGWLGDNSNAFLGGFRLWSSENRSGGQAGHSGPRNTRKKRGRRK